MLLSDKFGRTITDLRISVTDRCNYKCVYCRTGNEGALYGDLPFADYLRMARVLVGLGIQKVRITGGEPLLRSGVVDFVRELAKLRTTDGDDLDIALTTNGVKLAEVAHDLMQAWLTFAVFDNARRAHLGIARAARARQSSPGPRQPSPGPGQPPPRVESP